MTERAKEPLTPLAGPFGHPVHPLLIPVPIGAWVVSFGFDLASQIVDRPEAFARASFWLIAAGLAVGALAALAGFLDFVRIPAGTRVYRVALTHALLACTLLILYGVSLMLRIGGLDGPVGTLPLLVSGVALAGLAVTGFLGGELAYRYGVRVADEGTQARGFLPIGRGDRPASHTRKSNGKGERT